ncbi:MAG: HAD family hydrolase [Candidatus Andersenbacteria bacterium CG10_big_fil_rev_8_21_14_0_10_54_11]|uniref:HAD family hydrolase n=1 Tax=Candidatus Andersenbacteria bacterium CG10_big_fil_rev_8_21_14_0_10_54_11 TaxID=1974485 RepID=A0A2M6X0A7_9BACT|nr:MAG: HAD family hydrolase [Candidatus Andersenbacteria bacterium CG10_big_fil_rev_8_21_14_0_10_54_11]
MYPDFVIVVPPVAALWDLDGLIFDTEPIYDALFQDYAVVTIGARMPEEKFREMRARMFGSTVLDSARILHETLGLTDPPEVHVQWRETYNLEGRFREQTAVLPGVRKVLTRLQEAGMPLALATSSPRRMLKAKAARHPWLWDVFGDNIVTGDEVTNGKPDPELFVTAAEKLGVPREDFGRVLVFEDAPNGVAAAKTAGMKVIAVPYPLLDRSLMVEADQVLGSLEDFDPEEWGIR